MGAINDQPSALNLKHRIRWYILGKHSHDMLFGASNTEVDDDIPLINFSESDAEMTSTLHAEIQNFDLNASRGNEHNLEERQFNIDIQDFQINTEEIEEARRSFEYNDAEGNKNVATFFPKQM